ncbi:MAG: N-6 DNA methylase [Rhizobiales bacterium]|nr:N-6 DNA methylase [Hyphomicrobiales bacterium]
MTDHEAYARYLLALRRTPLDDKTEHTDRGALENLLQAVAESCNPGTTVQNEPKRVAAKGAPDFKISRKGLILGYVENKAIGENLDKILRSTQITNYKSLSQNIVLTDYLHFIWISKDGIQREVLCHATDLENPRFKLREDRIVAVHKLLQGFFSTAPEGIGRSQQLALALATRSKLLRDYLAEELVRQEREHKEGKLYGLFQVFRDQVFHELTLKEFADAFAQMLAYGLFLARLNSGAEPVTLHNAREYVPGSFRLIRELIDFLTELDRNEYRDIRWVVEEVLSIVNGLDLPAIHEDLSFKQRKAISRKVRASDEDEHRLFERDPFIYFYEDYLKAYDPKMRKGRGVYYTPPPIVNFIIRAVDDILKRTFEIADGLADHKRVTLLDFACGTGTFLLEVFQRIFDNIGGPESGRADLIVREHMLKNLFGFEYLIAPYTIAHLKLSQYLKDKGHVLKDRERLQVFLTNTLEPIHPEPNFLLPAVAAEAKAAQVVKDRPILVITGNPPYSGHSKNKGEWITRSIDGYKFTTEIDDAGREFQKPLGERNPKWLNDDYVKFIRFAQLKMDVVDAGIVGIITNHSWLDNPTFRGMRQSLMRTFEQIYVIDLHGSTKRKERAPDGSEDENVFDIQQGVAISIFIKGGNLEHGVWRADIWGKRLSKYRVAADEALQTIGVVPISPASPSYLFLKQDEVVRGEYEAGWRITDIMPTNVLGFQTHRDAFAISFSEAEMFSKLSLFSDPHVAEEELHQLYGLKSNRDWSLPDARESARKGMLKQPQVIAYRPFDERWSEFSALTMDYPRRELLDHVAGRKNLSLLVPRQIGIGSWQHAFVTNLPAESCLISSDTKSQNYVFPLYTFGKDGTAHENLGEQFRNGIDARYDRLYTPQEVMAYVYAVLHAPSYRRRYLEFLRADFPRIPLPVTAESFEALSHLGWALVQAHLLRDVPKKGLATYHGKGDHIVDAVRYSPDDKAIWINESQMFKPVPQEIWDFHIGGYRVLDKYLKSRKGRKLSLDEINHIGRVADSLAFTIQQMGKIDEAYLKAFPDRG